MVAILLWNGNGAAAGGESAGGAADAPCLSALCSGRECGGAAPHCMPPPPPQPSPPVSTGEECVRNATGHRSGRESRARHNDEHIQAATIRTAAPRQGVSCWGAAGRITGCCSGTAYCAVDAGRSSAHAHLDRILTRAKRAQGACACCLSSTR